MALVAVTPAASAEVAGSQFQISSSNHDFMPANAYDSTHNRYLVAWLDESGTDDVLRAQLMDGGGSRVGSPVAIYTYSGTGWGSPGIVYNARDDQFLVTWALDSDVLAQRLASDGSLTGEPITLSSRNYSDTDEQSDVAWSPDAGAYLVVWHGINAGVGGDSVRGRLVAPDGTLPDSSDFTVSAVDTWHVTVAYNTVAHEFLVAWTQYNGTNQGWGIWGRRVATDGTTPAASSRISQSAISDANRPRIAFDPDNNRYLVVWVDPTIDQGGVCGTLAFGAHEVFGQLVNADGTLFGSTFQISNRAHLDVGMGVLEARCRAGANGPMVAYDPATDRYLVVFSESATKRGTWQDAEIYGDYVTSEGGLVGTRDFQISDMGTWQSPYLVGLRPAVSFNSTDGEFLTTWFGVTTRGTLTDDDHNIWGSRVSGSEPTSPPPTETTPPQTAIKLYSTNWDAQNSPEMSFYPLIVTANAFDGLAGSGIAQIRCAVDPGSAPTSFADLPDAPCAPLTLNTEGQHTVYAATIDKSDNTSAVVNKTVQIVYDQVGPTLAPTVSPSSTLVLNQTGASASANATDALSGVWTSGCDAIDTSTLGQHTVQCDAYDGVGNYSTASVSYLVGYKTSFLSPSDQASYTAGKTVSIDVTLGDYTNTPTSTAAALAMAKSAQVNVSVSGTVTMASTPMKYSRSTNQFSYRLRIPRTATTGTATITVTIKYNDTTLTSTATQNFGVTGLLSSPSAEVLPSATPTIAAPPEVQQQTTTGAVQPDLSGQGQESGAGTQRTDSTELGTASEDATMSPKGGD